MSEPTTYPRAEVEAAYHEIVAAGDAGDWERWAELHTEDCEWVEHHYGTIVGRDAIRGTITSLMAPVPMMQFPVEWYVIEGNRVVYFPWQVFPDPEGRRRRVPLRVHHGARVRGRRAVLTSGGRLQPGRGRSRRHALARRRRTARRRPRRARDRGVMDRTFRFGVHTSDAAPGTAWIDAARRIESLGFATLQLRDHFDRQLAPDRGDDRGRGRHRDAARRRASCSPTTTAIRWCSPRSSRRSTTSRTVASRSGSAPGGWHPTTSRPACRSTRPACACRGSRRP